ncbi:MAG: polyprenol monophosphomannose synthase [Deltaproteobacteria bacterium]|nr:polyprenol monophosphomannose synthase [Deltaproteobacteria bacterium]
MAGSLIIIPTYDERENLRAIASRIHEVVPEVHLLVVDDNSPDGTGEVADDLAAKDERIHVLHRPGKMGLGTAYVEGFRKGLAEGYDLLWEMDADFSHDPRYLPDMLAAMDNGADLAIGSRYVPGGGTENWGLRRKVLSKGGGVYARMVLGVPIKDLTSGFRCYRREVLERISLSEVRAEGYAFQIEMAYKTFKAGFRVEEVPILFVDRRVGKSKMSGGIVWEAVLGVWRLKLGL